MLELINSDNKCLDNPNTLEAQFNTDYLNNYDYLRILLRKAKLAIIYNVIVK